MRKRERVLIGLSGGVDSIVSAYLLREQGFEVLGITFILHSKHDLERVRRLAEKLKIELIELDLSSNFEKGVINYFLEEYAKGRTPNPCAICNRHIKFLELDKQASLLGADYIATGHYARVSRNPLKLMKGKDPKKDQSYFLSLVKPEILKRALFPLGEMTREEVLEIAKSLNIDNIVNPKGSQDICFIEDSFRNFIKKALRDRLKKGIIRDSSGKVLGEHEGIALYTIGQRRRLNIATGKRQYVIALDPERNEVILGNPEDLLKEEFTVKEVNWLINEAKLEGEIKIRYHTPPSKAIVLPIEKDRVKVILKEPIFAVTPGQLATFYIEDQVAWGGIIE